jgi:hypothetical protein
LSSAPDVLDAIEVARAGFDARKRTTTLPVGDTIAGL